MTWEAAGALGEIIGAIAVVVTLAYLAVQVRQNSHHLEQTLEASRLAADDAVSRGFDRWRELMVTDSDTVDLFLRGMEDIESLEPAERLRFNYILASFSWLAWQVWRAQSLMGETNAEILRHLLLHPGGRSWYISHRAFIPPDFRLAVDEVLEQLRRDETPFLRPEDSSSMFSGALRESAGESDG